MITIISQPQKFSPSNIANFQISSDVSGLTYFDVQVLDSNDNIITRQKYNPLPNYLSGSTFDLSSMLSSYVDFQLVNSSNIIEPTANILLTYKLNIVENYISGNEIVSGSTLTTGNFNIWNAKLQRTDVADYDYHKYVINSASGGTKFLTDKPLVNNIYPESLEYLYFLNDGLNAKIKLDFYKAGNTLIKTQYVTGITSSMSAARLNVSPKSLSIGVGPVLEIKEFTNEFTIEFGSAVNLLSASYFNVTIVDSSNNPKSETRTYVLKNTNKCKQTLELIFSNAIGGYESLVCNNPMESINVQATSISKYPYQINNSNQYTDLNNGVYNETSSVISLNSTSTYSCITDVLSDASAKWLRSLITSEKIYLRLANGRLYPVSLLNSSYSIKQKRYSTDNNRLQIQFTSDVAGLFD